jgi:hypothetical protein
MPVKEAQMAACGPARTTQIAYWIVFFSVGLPLFKDTNAALGINIKGFLNVRDMLHTPKDGT